LRDQVDAALGGLGATITTLAAKYSFPAATTAASPAATSAAPLTHDDKSTIGATGGSQPETVPPPAATATPAAVNAPTPAASSAAASSAPTLAAASVPANVENIAAGRKLFNETCSHCHGPDAVQGEQRRNLRLLRQRYGEDMGQTFMTTVTHGRVSKGMPNWSGIISNDEFDKILAFLASVQEPGS